MWKFFFGFFPKNFSLFITDLWCYFFTHLSIWAIGSSNSDIWTLFFFCRLIVYQQSWRMPNTKEKKKEKRMPQATNKCVCVCVFVLWKQFHQISHSLRLLLLLSLLWIRLLVITIILSSINIYLCVCVCVWITVGSFIPIILLSLNQIWNLFFLEWMAFSCVCVCLCQHLFLMKGGFVIPPIIIYDHNG